MFDLLSALLQLAFVLCICLSVIFLAFTKLLSFLLALAVKHLIIKIKEVSYFLYRTTNNFIEVVKLKQRQF